MNEVIEKLCRIKTQYAINRLNPSSTDMIFIQYEELCLELNKQLQASKDKEDKLISQLSNNDFSRYNNELQNALLKEHIKICLQILNEGSDK